MGKIAERGWFGLSAVAASFLVAGCGGSPAEQGNATSAAPQSVPHPQEAARVTQGESTPADELPPVKAGLTPARRCGWLHNPTPGNWWLIDRDGEWILGTQGGRMAEGMDDMPDMSEGEWQETNGHYGYGCACLTITADPETREVFRFASPESKPLAACRADKALPEPGA